MRSSTRWCNSAFSRSMYYLMRRICTACRFDRRLEVCQQIAARLCPQGGWCTCIVHNKTWVEPTSGMLHSQLKSRTRDQVARVGPVERLPRDRKEFGSAAAATQPVEQIAVIIGHSGRFDVVLSLNLVMLKWVYVSLTSCQPALDLQRSQNFTSDAVVSIRSFCLSQ